MSKVNSTGHLSGGKSSDSSPPCGRPTWQHLPPHTVLRAPSSLHAGWICGIPTAALAKAPLPGQAPPKTTTCPTWAKHTQQPHTAAAHTKGLIVKSTVIATHGMAGARRRWGRGAKGSRRRRRPRDEADMCTLLLHLLLLPSQELKTPPRSSRHVKEKEKTSSRSSVRRDRSEEKVARHQKKVQAWSCPYQGSPAHPHGWDRQEARERRAGKVALHEEGVTGPAGEGRRAWEWVAGRGSNCPTQPLTPASALHAKAGHHARRPLLTCVRSQEAWPSLKRPLPRGCCTGPHAGRSCLTAAAWAG